MSEDLAMVKDALNFYNASIWAYYSSYKDRNSVKDWHIYLIHDDVMQLANLLLGVGPAIVATTLATFMSVVPRAGTIIGAVIGFFGAASIVGNVTYVAATGKGLKIGLTGISAI